MLEKRAPFNGMRGKRGEEMAVQQPDQVNILMLMMMMLVIMCNGRVEIAVQQPDQVNILMLMMVVVITCKMCSLVEVI